MTLVVETGAGVRGANSLVTTAFVDAYLAERGRSDENGWGGLASAEKQGHAIAGTQYLEARWGTHLRGAREFEFADVRSTATLTLAGLPLDAESFLLGDQTFTFVSALTGAADEVLIGADADETASNVASAISGAAEGLGTTHGSAVPSRHATASVEGGVVTLTATADGASGDATAFSGTITNGTLTAFSGGLDGGPQALSFPRVGLVSRDGVAILGVPLNAKRAVAEYAVRSASGKLFRDPTIDPRGGVVTRTSEKVGPIEEEVEYQPGTAGVGQPIPYPAADRLLAEYLRPLGRATR